MFLCNIYIFLCVSIYIYIYACLCIYIYIYMFGVGNSSMPNLSVFSPSISGTLYYVRHHMIR